MVIHVLVNVEDLGAIKRVTTMQTASWKASGLQVLRLAIMGGVDLENLIGRSGAEFAITDNEWGHSQDDNIWGSIFEEAKSWIGNFSKLSRPAVYYGNIQDIISYHEDIRTYFNKIGMEQTTKQRRKGLTLKLPQLLCRPPTLSDWQIIPSALSQAVHRNSLTATLPPLVQQLLPQKEPVHVPFKSAEEERTHLEEASVEDLEAQGNYIDLRYEPEDQKAEAMES
ncbi:hypothetical protein DL96DRAFT_1709903 [Flagelloscypha sp. PMI_526]|nr:hypothetical protein DL96DRAFT_1709903 [Flagelloscypha sp. PMI_526]